MKNIVLPILGALISAAIGIVLSQFTIGWVGQTITLWGCAALIFFGFVIGMRQTVIEGIVLTAILTGLGYAILKTFPAYLPLFPGSLAGISILMIVIGMIEESKEAPRREAQKRKWKEQQAQEEARWKAREAETEARWQEHRRRTAKLPVLSPMADITECINAFRNYLNRVWHRLPQKLFESNEFGYEHVHTWLHRQFIKIVEKPLGCRLDMHYGDYDWEFDEELPGGEPEQPADLEYQPMEIWVNEKYEFDCLITIRDGVYYVEPPFDYIKVFEDRGPEEARGSTTIPLDQARFELRPASWISQS